MVEGMFFRQGKGKTHRWYVQLADGVQCQVFWYDYGHSRFCQHCITCGLMPFHTFHDAVGVLAAADEVRFTQLFLLMSLALGRLFAIMACPPDHGWPVCSSSIAVL